jgi:PhzF family phenazine biosynthesis protein
VSFELYQVDAFSDRPFAGNPAAVCLCPEAREPVWMQQVASEMNLSETAFLVARADGYDLRWFTPQTEVELCGHATLASAHVLWESGRLAASATARFHTASGVLTAERRGGWIELDFPALPAAAVPDPPAALLRAVGAAPLWVGSHGPDYLVELESEAAVRAAQPDLALLVEVPARGLILTAAASTPAFDFVSRFFCPGAGVAEDPVTGAAHCSLGPFWGPRLGKDEMAAFQASARGGTLRVRLAGDRVKLLGQAVTILQGKLLAV